jgi:two-component system LytT family response regulator
MEQVATATIRAAIVDDEPLACEAIRLRLRDEHDVDVIGEAADGSAAVDLITNERPDLLFLDVQMPHMDGFEVLDTVAPTFLPMVVFVTAYDQYALKAFETHALDYLLKPFTGERFRAAVHRARVAFENGGAPEAHRGLLKLLDDRQRRHEEWGERYLVRFAVRHKRKIKLVRVTDIDWIEAGGNYAQIHVGDTCHLVRMTMQELEQRLDPALFVRVHRSTIVQIDRIGDIAPVSHGDFDLTLKNGVTLRLSRNYRSRLQR